MNRMESLSNLWAQQHADDQFAHDRRQAERPQGDGDKPDAGEQDQQVKGDFMHGKARTKILWASAR